MHRKLRFQGKPDFDQPITLPDVTACIATVTRKHSNCQHNLDTKRVRSHSSQPKAGVEANSVLNP